jgi:hypothetical protein
MVANIRHLHSEAKHSIGKMEKFLRMLYSENLPKSDFIIITQINENKCPCPTFEFGKEVFGKTVIWILMGLRFLSNLPSILEIYCFSKKTDIQMSDYISSLFKAKIT